MELTKQELEDLYLTLEKPLYNFTLRWIWNSSLAQELVHDAFIKIWVHPNVDRATIKGLLYKTAQNLALNERRKARVREALPVLDWLLGTPPMRVDEDFLRQEDLTLAFKGIESLPNEFRETFLLCQFSDMSYDEIGAVLEISSGTVASRKSRALKLLKAVMEAHHDR